MEDLGQRADPLVGAVLCQVDEEVSHLGLPPGVDVGGSHGCLSGWEVVALEIADELAVVGQEERVVAPSALAECRPHLGPHISVPLAIFVKPRRIHLEPEADTGHRRLPTVGRTVGMMSPSGSAGWHRPRWGVRQKLNFSTFDLSNTVGGPRTTEGPVSAVGARMV